MLKKKISIAYAKKLQEKAELFYLEIYSLTGAAVWMDNEALG
ncbi:hypothetical protein ACVWYG_000238 [Pedobacter sp. UYEF25]